MLSAAHALYLLLPSLERREALTAALAARGITAIFHYLPLHLSTMGRRLGGRPGECPITEDVSDRLERLPLSAGLTDSEQERGIAALREAAGM